MRRDGLVRFVAHSRTILSIAMQYGWKPAARYTNLRDIRHLPCLGFLDIEWRNYSFERHLEAARSLKPMTTVARDVLDIKELDGILHEASLLARYSENVVVVPKDPRLRNKIERLIPPEFVLGYSVPTRYGGTQIPAGAFKGPVHLLGGRPDVQRDLADRMDVVSVACNRFTLDAAFGDYNDRGAHRDFCQKTVAAESPHGDPGRGNRGSHDCSHRPAGRATVEMWGVRAAVSRGPGSGGICRCGNCPGNCVTARGRWSARAAVCGGRTFPGPSRGRE
jgi:hypothetical protein